jgi:hypothetical protein
MFDKRGVMERDDMEDLVVSACILAFAAGLVWLIIHLFHL